MFKYLYSQIYTKEIPDHLSLGFSITGCPIHCPECHSPHTWDKNLGTELTIEELNRLLKINHYASTVLFFGGEWDIEYLKILLQECKDHGFKTALYSGHTLIWFQSKHPELLTYLDFLKVGPYNPIYGSLDYPSTNQRLYEINNSVLHGIQLINITDKFWRTNIK